MATEWDEVEDVEPDEIEDPSILAAAGPAPALTELEGLDDRGDDFARLDDDSDF